MSRILALLLLLALPAQADEARRLAICTGKLSAWVEHQWLMQEASEQTQAQRDALARRMAEAGGAMALRVEAKAAMAAALAEATFGHAPLAPLQRQITTCLRLLPQA